MKTYTQAPLPFQGQKRRFVKQFKEALKAFPENAVYVDLFGGSGLLSHTVKTVYPDAKVIYNDFDNYFQRIENIDKTNILIADFRKILKDYEPDIRITGIHREKILERIKKEKGFVDYITVSSSVCFSMNYKTSFEALEKDTIYNRVKQTAYNADDYLHGVTRVRKDYRDLFSEYRNVPNVVFLVDPPYLSTDVSTYSRSDYWKLTDYLNVLKTIEDASYFYFTSNKSQILELCNWMEQNGYCRNPFSGSTTVEVNTTLTHKSNYTDIMIYKTNE